MLEQSSCLSTYKIKHGHAPDPKSLTAFGPGDAHRLNDEKMEIIIFAVIIAAFLYWYLILRPGKLPFWRVASKYPDAAYDFFSTSECFKVFEGNLPKNHKDILPSEKWVGPFRLYVPKIGNRIIYVFGKAREYEQAQDDFLQLVKNRK